MRHVEGKISDKGLTATVRDLYRNRRTGQLRLTAERHNERFYFVNGELFVAADHPLAEAVRSQMIAQRGADDRATPEARLRLSATARQGRELAAALAGRLAGWREGSYLFVEGAGKVPGDLIGPVSTVLILMETAVHGQEEFQLLRQLGGQERRFVAPKAAAAAAVELDPHEAFFLSRLEQPMAVKDLLRLVDLSSRQALERICRLYAADLIRPQEEMPIEVTPEFASGDLVRRLRERVGKDLDRRPLELEVEAHRARLKELLGGLGEMNHYEMLNVPLGAGADAVYDAFMKVARIVHPAHGPRLGLGRRRVGLDLLFERCTEAYLTLSDPERTRAYHDRLGSALIGEQFRPSEEERQTEKREVAATKYRTAVNFAAANEFHFAVQLLKQAVDIDPQADYYQLLGECQEHNPRWQADALKSYSKAVQLKRNDPELRTRLATCYEKAGNPERAREEFEAALERMPGYPDAVAGLQRLQAPVPRESGGSFFGNLMARWRGKPDEPGGEPGVE